MTLNIQTATVLGAGTMGAAIAGLLADAGIRVHLLDLASDPDPNINIEGVAPVQVGRSQLAWQGLTRMTAARPPNLVHKESRSLIRPGNMDEDLETALGESEWVLEAVIEDMETKRSLLQRLADLNPACRLITTNTSGLPIHMLAEGLPADFASRFMGTHFFNPPRYLPLLELIPHAGTDPALLADFGTFSSVRLGRETVVCRDTPYFIANRLFAFIHQVTINTALDMGLTVAEVDGLTGSLLGRPNAATFRLADIVGLDVMDLVCRNLDDLTPDDPCRSVRFHEGYRAMLASLLASGHLGSKTGQGFYRTEYDANGKRQFLALDLAEAVEGRLSWIPAPRFSDEAIDTLHGMPLAERFPALLKLDNRFGEFLWRVHGQVFSYLSQISGEIAEDCHAIDRVIRTGFAWQLGPFELWDALGPESLNRMQQSGMHPGEWTAEVLASSGTSFHRSANGKRTSWNFRGGMNPVPAEVNYHAYADAMRTGQAIAENESACLRTGQDGILFLETRSVLNTIDEQVLSVCQEACDQLHGSAAGLIIANDDDIFSAGANLKLILALLEAADWQELERLAKLGQDTFMALRQAPKPVWAAARGMTAGGGVELLLSLDGVVAYPEACLGLTESAVGLVPGWGGCKELVRRSLAREFLDRGGDAHQVLKDRHAQVAMAKISDNAQDAQAMGYLPQQASLVTRRSQLLPWAVRELQRSLDLGYVPPAVHQNTYAAGRDGLANLEMEVFMYREAGYISEHDALIATKLAHVLCGGRLASPAWMDEQWFLDLEREANLSLAGEILSRDRIVHMLTQKKPLRN